MSGRVYRQTLFVGGLSGGQRTPKRAAHKLRRGPLFSQFCTLHSLRQTAYAFDAIQRDFRLMTTIVVPAGPVGFLRTEMIDHFTSAWAPNSVRVASSPSPR